MKHLSIFFSLITTIFFSSSISGQTFPCDGRRLISSTDHSSTTISYYLAIPFGPRFFSPMATYRNARIDALGFNSLDNYIYGIQENTNAVVRLKRDNTFDTVGTVSFMDTLKSFAGDCTPDGLYLCHDNTLNQLLVFDVVDGFELIDRIDLFWDPASVNSGPFKSQIFDFAINPNNPKVAFSYQGFDEHPELEPDLTRGYSLSINVDFADANVGMVTPIAPLDSNIVMHLGGLLFTPNSTLFGFGSSLPGLNPIENTYYAINPFSGDVINTGTMSPRAELSDGCSCPYSFTFSQLAPQDGIQCSNDDNKFVFTINNYSFNEISDAVFSDTFPEGLIIDDIKGNYEGIMAPGTGIGTNVLKINQFYIPPKSEIEIVVKVRSIDLTVGYNFNQAFLLNLPERYGGVMPSDEPFTIGKQGDPSKFSVFAKRIDDLTWEISPPSDCIIANDAQVLLNSPQFIPGQKYEIAMRNKIGWQETIWKVTTDSDNSLLLDSLIPGNYQLFNIRSENDNCSLALKDTTVIVSAPNEQLSLTTNSNSPVCEGENLSLTTEVFPSARMKWRGPNIFGSEEGSPLIEAAKPVQGGEYRVEATYGYCKQFDTIDVQVAPAVEALISGDLDYCERDTLFLEAEGTGDTTFFQWSGPNSLYRSQKMVFNPSINQNDEGYYEVIVSNGACKDTAGLMVTVLPSPTISLPTLIETDYCSSVILNPEISGDNDVIYSWLPDIGLSCTDCASPQVLPIVQNGYSLKVINDYLCSDSAYVKITLDKQKILLAPNVFRPNSFEANDRFVVTPKCIVQEIKKLKVFDRWGNEVYAKQSLDFNNIDEFWNGDVGGRIGFPGVYIWVAEIELVDGTIEIITGDITILP